MGATDDLRGRQAAAASRNRVREGRFAGPGTRDQEPGAEEVEQPRRRRWRARGSSKHFAHRCSKWARCWRHLRWWISLQGARSRGQSCGCRVRRRQSSWCRTISPWPGESVSGARGWTTAPPADPRGSRGWLRQRWRTETETTALRALPAEGSTRGGQFGGIKRKQTRVLRRHGGVCRRPDG